MKPKRDWRGRVSWTKHLLMMEPLHFKEAPEPTDIIWENRNVTKKQQNRRKVVVVLIIIGLLIAAFVIFYYLKGQTIDNVKRYPPTQDCSSIASYFDDNYDSQQFKDFAQTDMDLTKKFVGTGIYQCYCKDY